MKNMTQAEKDRKGWELRWRTAINRKCSILRGMIAGAWTLDEVYAQARECASAARCFQSLRENGR